MKKLIALILVVASLFAAACGGIDGTSSDGGEEKGVADGFSVHFIDVGEGDCIFIRLPDRKSMLIDAGENSEANFSSIRSVLTRYGVERIDYLVLTHPDGDHIGNACALVEAFGVGTAYLPYVYDTSAFTKYDEAVNALKADGALIKYSQIQTAVVGTDYAVFFLSPAPKDAGGGAYDDFNSTLTPSAQARNDVSPIIYLEYAGVRFVFTGDAGFGQEEYVLLNEASGLYEKFFAYYGRECKLENVDFLKVSHHGADDACGNDFLSLLKPNNAVISVGGQSYYKHPSTATINRILGANEACSIYRTDIYGTISVFVDETGKYEIKTEKD